jgi:hypothetical protein
VTRVLKTQTNVTRVLQDQQRLAERAHDNCRRDLEQQMASNEELSSEMQVSRKRVAVPAQFGVTRAQQLLEQLRSTESLAETLEHENEQVLAAR